MAGKKALEGIRVLDLTAALSGPFCSMVLADLGAEVIKIEPPEGDIFRKMGPHFRGEWSSYFVAIHRNKLGVVLNLKTKDGLQAFYDLVKVSDVVLDNFRPGVTDRLQIQHSVLSELNPRVVTCSITGYGAGVAAERTAFDICVVAASGVLSTTGDEEGNLARPGVPIADLAAGQFAALGIVAALNERNASGRGQHVDISMFDAQLSLLSYMISWYTASGVVPKPLGTGHLGLEPYGAYRTRDGQVVLAIGSEKFWVELCQVLGAPELASDPRFDEAMHRQANRGELRETLERILATRTTPEWIELLEAAGIPSAPVNTVDKALQEPCVAERNMLVTVEQPGYGIAHLAGNPVKLSRTGTEDFRPAPFLGEHTTRVLTGLLGYSRARVEQMVKEGAAAQWRPPAHGVSAPAPSSWPSEGRGASTVPPSVAWKQIKAGHSSLPGSIPLQGGGDRAGLPTESASG